MLTITLPPELEILVNEQSRSQGTSPQMWTVEILRRALESSKSQAEMNSANPVDGTMADFFEGYIGVIDSSEFVNGGAQMSTDSGRKFAEGMIQKRKSGKL